MATIKDVARLAGVGVGTASRALSGKGSVSADALARVNAAVAELSFSPSTVARALASKSAGMLGVYLPDFSGSFYGPILQTLDRELRAVDRHMVAANGCGHGDARMRALEGVRFLMQRECDGILILSDALFDSDLLDIHARFPRIAVLNRRTAGIDADCFTADHEVGGRLAAQALLERGHRDIAVISGPHRAADNEARMAGFHGELARHHLKVDPAQRAEGDFTGESGRLAMRSLLARGQRWSAVFAANDLMAMAAVSVLADAGLRVPQDVSVLGYDDSEVAAYTSPRLTSVRIPIDEAARNAAHHLLNRCYGFKLPVTHQFAPRLVWRESVATVTATPRTRAPRKPRT